MLFKCHGISLKMVELPKLSPTIIRHNKDCNKTAQQSITRKEKGYQNTDLFHFPITWRVEFIL